MARIKGGVLRGRVGNVVYSEWKGIALPPKMGMAAIFFLKPIHLLLHWTEN